MEEIERIQITQDQSPKDDDYLLGGPSWHYRNGRIVIRDEPLFLFKKDSKFRIWAENILKKYNLYDTHTLMFVTDLNWYNKFAVIKKFDL